MSEIPHKLEIQSQNHLKVLEIIKSENHEARLIGGVVRDSFLAIKSHDIDIATSMRPDQVMKVFLDRGAKVFPIGLEFGTVLVLYRGESFEITTLRKDISCNGRHAKVEYTNDFYLDAMRRDFTINALSYCPFKEIIYDYFNGLEDLYKGCVKFIGDPEERIAEDYLRILRFFRFHGRFGKQLDQKSFESCIKHKSFLKKLSRERIKSEFDFILGLPSYLEVLILGKEILPEIFPICEVGEEQERGIFKNLNMAEEIAAKMGVALSPELKYALLFNGNDFSVKELVLLKFSKKEARTIDSLNVIMAQARNDDSLLKKIWLDYENFADFFILLAATRPSEKEKIISLYLELKNKAKPVFPIDGNHIKSFAITGSDIKTALSKLERIWIESNFELTQDELLKLYLFSPYPYKEGDFL